MAPPVLPVLENDPVTKGTSWPTFKLASSLSVVTIEGVEIIFVSAIPSNVLNIDAKLVPCLVIFPTPIDIPCPMKLDGLILMLLLLFVRPAS